MSATRDLIAAALTAADELDQLHSPIRSLRADELREACARAMVQPDVSEVERLINEFGASCNSVAKRGHITSFKPLGQQITEHRASRTTLLDYVRGILAERDQFRDAAKMVSAAPQPVSAAEVPMPEPDTHCYDDDVGRDVWSHSPEQMRTYGEQCRAAGFAVGVTSGAKQMFDYIQFAAANTSDTEWDTRLCELSQDALAAVSPAAHTEWKTIQRVASESRAAGEAAGYARGLAEGRERCAVEAWMYYMDTCKRNGIGPDVYPQWCCAAALRGEVKP